MSKTCIQERGSMAVSDNGKVYEGMQKPDASDISKMSVFNFADKNKDGVISRAEVERYNAPIFMKNYDTNREIMLSGNKPTGFQTDGYTEFYSGLELKNVSQKAAADYKIIDLDNNGVISKAEMQAMEKAFNVTQNIKKEVKTIAEKTNILTTIIGGACAAVPLGMITWFISDFEGITHAAFGKYMAVSGGIALGLLLASVGIALICKKLADNKAKELAKTTENHPYVLSQKENIQKEYNTSTAY